MSQLPITKNSKNKTGQHRLRSKIWGPFDKHALHIYLLLKCKTHRFQISLLLRWQEVQRLFVDGFV